MKIAVLGAGAWGTALANLLCANKNDVTLWGHDPEHLLAAQRAGCNERYLPGIKLCSALKLETDLAKAISETDVVVIAVPSKFFRAVTEKISQFGGVAVSVTKGIEYETGRTMSALLKSTMPKATAAALSGPTFAVEIARELPGAAVIAQADAAVAQRVQLLFNRPTFRVYTSSDVLGVELGGALKNVVAIAAGIGDGLGFGDNSKAALVTRAIAEIRRLGVACGANAETFSGLSGLGDLTLTCFSTQSRNHTFGERIGRGETAEQILSSVITVAEGYPTARSAFQLARKLKVETPIIDEVHAMLYENKNVRQAVHDLMSRDLKPED